MFKNHPLSMVCAYTMVGAVIAFGLSGIVLDNPHMLPASWAPLIAFAPTALIASLLTAFVAASILSMRAAAFAETAFQAKQRHILWLTIGLTIGCLIIEVYLGKSGAAKLGLDIGTFELTLALVFFALAPRAMSVVGAAITKIREADAAAEKEVDHRHDLERIREVAQVSEARIQRGNVARLEEARKTQAAGAAALTGAMLLGAGVSDAIPELPLPEPAPRVSTMAETNDDLAIDDATHDERAKMAVRVGDALYAAGEAPTTRAIAERLGIKQKRADRWLDWAGLSYDHQLRQWDRWPRPLSGSPPRRYG